VLRQFQVLVACVRTAAECRRAFIDQGGRVRHGAHDGCGLVQRVLQAGGGAACQHRDQHGVGGKSVADFVEHAGGLLRLHG
jgi:hypothetical protein